jgi:nicotinamide mononucleotide transporter
LEAALQYLTAMTGERPIEIIAVFLGLINITLLIRRSIWNYPFGIVMVALYAQVFYEAKLYSDAGLQIFFLVVQAYGWFYWRKRRDAQGLVIVKRIEQKHALIYAAAAIVSIAVLGTAMDRFTDASYPYWDGSIAVLSVIAQILLARRMLENWLIWIAVDMLAIGLFWVKGLHPTAVLYVLFLMLASAGYFNWRRAWASGEKTSP